MNPPATETTFAELIRGCVEQNTNSDWVAFRARTRTLVRGTIIRYSQWSHLVDEFEDWFFGWLAAGTRLQAALNAQRKDYQDPECVHIGARERSARSYFRTIVESGRAEFLAENCSQLPVAPDVDPDNTPGHNPWQEIAEQAEQVRAVARQLSTNLRITFSLKHLEYFWPLIEDDECELRNRNPHRLVWLDERLSAFRERSPTSAEIGEVLGVQPNNVDQFYRRARIRIRERLGLPP